MHLNQYTTDSFNEFKWKTPIIHISNNVYGLQTRFFNWLSNNFQKYNAQIQPFQYDNLCDSRANMQCSTMTLQHNISSNISWSPLCCC